MSTGPQGHARLSPSAAERWLSCPASVLVIEENGPFPPSDSVHARAGTAAHALGEIKARHRLLDTPEGEWIRARNRWARENPTYQDEELEEMEEKTDDYVEFLHDRLLDYPHSRLLLEQRLFTGVDGCWGTSDAVIVSPEHVSIVDLKYGQGLWVGAPGNPQLRLYAAGALRSYGDLLGDTEVVQMHIFQPRLGNISSDEKTPRELREWVSRVAAIADQAVRPGAPFGPSSKACRWCPLSGRCQAQSEQALARDFGTDPALLTPEEMERALDDLPMIEGWARAVRAQALDMMYSQGKPIPGYKVVASSGRRFIADPMGAMDSLRDHQVPLSEVTTTALVGIGKLEKHLGKSSFEEIIGPYISKTEGAPSVVLESDRRSAITPNTEAVRDFS